MNELSPIVLFVYNRLWHTEQTIEALKKNELASESDLFVFSDGPRVEGDENVRKVREYIHNVDGFKSVRIVEREKNLGLANSVIAGVTEIVNKYGKIIVLEDDIVTSCHFLRFMNSALEKYKNDKRLFAISGYNVSMEPYPEYQLSVFLAFRVSSWGWGTWKDRWDEADWEIKDWEEVFERKELYRKFARGGEDQPYVFKALTRGTLNSWAIRWYYSHFRKDRYTLFPVKSLVENTGFDGSGIHCGNAGNAPNKPMIRDDIGDSELPDKIEFNERMNILFVSHFKYGLKDILRRFVKELTGYRINK